jgi:hypothetical protein
MALGEAGPQLATIALFRHLRRQASGFAPILHRAELIAIVRVWKEALTSRRWPFIEYAPGALAEAHALERLVLLAASLAQTPRLDETIVEDLLAAFHGLRPWNEWEKEDFLDTLLLPGVRRPNEALVLAPAERSSRIRKVPRA